MIKYIFAFFISFSTFTAYAENLTMTYDEKINNHWDIIHESNESDIIMKTFHNKSKYKEATYIALPLKKDLNFKHMASEIIKGASKKADKVISVKEISYKGHEAMSFTGIGTMDKKSFRSHFIITLSENGVYIIKVITFMPNDKMDSETILFINGLTL